jgi:hypothetical protein
MSVIRWISKTTAETDNFGSRLSGIEEETAMLHALFFTPFAF